MSTLTYGNASQGDPPVYSWGKSGKPGMDGLSFRHIIYVTKYISKRPLLMPKSAA